MTNIELLTATPELTAALTAVRDELMTANSAAIGAATAAVNAERDKLSADLVAATKAGADALKAATDKAAYDAVAAKAAYDAAIGTVQADLAASNAARDKAVADLGALEIRSKALAASARTELLTVQTALQNLAVIATEANKGFDEAEASAIAAKKAALKAELDALA